MPLWLASFQHDFTPKQLALWVIFEPLNRGDGFEVEDGRSRFVGFFEIEGEMEGPVVDIVGGDDVDHEPAGVAARRTKKPPDGPAGNTALI